MDIPTPLTLFRECECPPESVPPQPVLPEAILSLDDIFSTVEVIQLTEAADRAVLHQLLNIDTDDLKKRLLAWGSLGFPPAHTLYTLQLNCLEKCSDGIQRMSFQYIHYLDPSFSISNVLAALETRLPGMTLSYSYTTTNTLCVHVSIKSTQY
jgi:hypothetical protein